MEFDIENICVACLNNANELQPLFETNLKDLYTNFTNLEIIAGDGLPSNICVRCVQSLHQCSSFRDQCIHSYSKLKENKAIKSEIDEGHQSDGNSSTGGHFDDFDSNFVVKEEDVGSAENNIGKDVETNKLQNIQKKSAIHKNNRSKKHEKVNQKEELVRKAKEDFKSLRIMLKRKSHDSIKVEEPDPETLDCNLYLVCPKCRQTFKEATALTAHYRGHLGDKAEAVCQECSSEFASKSGLKRHMKSHTKKFQCSDCGEEFIKSELKKHKKLVHKGKIKHICDVCGKLFPRSGYLKMHILQIHSELRPFACNVCNLKFKLLTVLKEHLKRHTGTKAFMCTTCGHRTVSKRELNSHMRVHVEGQPYACTKCPKRYKQLRHLLEHGKIHTGERPHLCDLCPMTFRTSTTRNNHRRTHTGEKPHVCGVCGKGFIQSFAMKIHMKTHIGVKHEDEDLDNA